MSERFYEQEEGGRRCAPAALRNLEPIAAVLAEWLPTAGLVLEIASGTGQHARAYAERFPHLAWQPTDIAPESLASIAAFESDAPSNFHPPKPLDVTQKNWPIAHADAVLAFNMVHISPWAASLGLLDGAARVLGPGGRLILYGPWREAEVATAPSNLDFDAMLKARDPQWGLRDRDSFAAEALARGLVLAGRRAMPANNIMLRFDKDG